MKFSSIANGHVGLILAASVLISSCNKDEFYPTEEMIAGIDKYCSKAPDLESCQELSACQPAFSMPEDETAEEPVFEACIADPDLWGPEGEDGAGSNDSTTGGTEEQDPDNGGGDDESGAGSTDGSTTGGDDGSSGNTSEAPAPTVPETVEANCQNLKDKYLHITNVIQKGKVIEVKKKVKVCHRTGNGTAFALIIACPALKAHVNHHDDTIGACEKE